MPKDPYTLAQQIDLLQGRGLTLDVTDRQHVARLLLDHNYYRLSGYWRYYQQAPHLGDNQFRPDASMATIERVYAFDASLRQTLLEGLADFEVAFRSRFAYFIATMHGPCTYLRQSSYRPETVHRRDRTVVNLAEEVQASILSDLRRSREDYIRHHVERSEPIPIWVAVESLSFGTISKAYRLFADDDVRYKVSRTFEVPDPLFLASLGHSFSVLRNICAHHGRVWNRRPEVPLKVLKSLKHDRDKSIYHQTPWAWLVMLAFLVDKIRRDQTFSSKLWDLIDDHEEFQEGLKYPHRR